MSLESGVMLCRLNHELLPDPGNPMARTTVPFEARGAAAGVVSRAPATSMCSPARSGDLRPSLRDAGSDWPGSCGLRSASASATSSPPPSAARISASGPGAAAVDAARAPAASSSTSGGEVRARARFNFRFGAFWFIYILEPPGRGIRGIVIGGLQRGLCRLALTGFRVLFGALETIAHPLAHVWFVTQLHSAGNPSGGNVPKLPACAWCVWPRATSPAKCRKLLRLVQAEQGIPTVGFLESSGSRDHAGEGARATWSTARTISFMPIPAAIKGQKYMSLASFRKNGNRRLHPNLVRRER